MNDNVMTRKPLASTAIPPEIGSVKETSGVPNYAPKPDQMPLAFDPNANTLYVYTDRWKAYGLSALEELNIDNIRELDDVIKIPIFYTVAGRNIQGHITLGELKHAMSR